MDLGFIILCPDKNIGGLRNTMFSINNNSYNRESVAIVGDNASTEEIKGMKEICQVHKGKETITSLINTGMKKIKHEWAFLLFAGSRIQPYVEKKLQFAKTEKDILFPVVNRKCDFVSGSFDGVMINTKFFREIGDFPDITLSKEDSTINEFEMAKLLWFMAACHKKAVFKAIIGLRVS